MEYNILQFNKIKYVIRYPDGYKDGNKCPVLIYLHGAGGRGENIDVIRNHKVFYLTEAHENFPFVTVAPQCYSNTWFDIFEQLQAFIKMIYASDFCDRERVYLTHIKKMYSWYNILVENGIVEFKVEEQEAE